MTNSFMGKAAIVTGGAHGIGKAIPFCWAAERVAIDM
jgi:NAD(P)-dependent dehydrogenase (short-subunit alcohol dehydrogenase family)